MKHKSLFYKFLVTENMKEYSLIMGLTDYISVIFFSVSGIIFSRTLYKEIKLKYLSMLIGGFWFTAFSGFCKATYKVLYGSGLCDFKVLNDVHMPLLSIGICMIGFSFIRITSPKNKSFNIYSAVPTAITSNTLFIVLDFIGIISIFIGIKRLAFSINAKKAVFFIAGFCIIEIITGFIGTMANFEQSCINWITQFLQTTATLLFLISSIIISKKMKSEIPATIVKDSTDSN